jgi:DNA-directed RNA polymerase subunit RPC12/RpoP
MDYEPSIQSKLSTDSYPSGTYICTTCAMTVDVISDNQKPPVCPCCEQQVFLTVEEDNYLRDKI